MYTKDKNIRLTLRLNEEQFNFVKGNADTLGVSPSEFLRMVVNATMASSKVASARMKEITDEMLSRRTAERISKVIEGEVEGRANDKTDSDDIV